MPSPNLLFVFGDQWRAQALGYAGDPNARTPSIDAFAAQSVHVTHAVSGCPVCSPYRAGLLTGQYPLTHGVFVNDVPLEPRGQTLGEALAGVGYDTAWIGKWHVDGHGRSAFIPPARRRGFRHWRTRECTHDYLHSTYHADSPEPLLWEGYDAAAQTREAIRYLRHERPPDRPWALFLSWGPPHEPYDRAPPDCLAACDPAALTLRPNVPPSRAAAARAQLAGYYAHGMALDRCFAALLAALRELDLEHDTLVVFTSDHGDMLGSQGAQAPKQQPWDESIRVPFLARWPARLRPATVPQVLDAPDVMPTLLGLLGLPAPAGVEGRDLAPVIRGERPADDLPALLLNVFCFHQWKPALGAREFRGVRTLRHTYVRCHEGPWLLYDNEDDPYQLRNLVAAASHQGLRRQLDDLLAACLERRADVFRPGRETLAQWGYRLDPDSMDLPIRW